MVPLLVLIVVTLVARLFGRAGIASLNEWAAAARVGLSVMFFFTAAAHFNSTRADLVRMVPPWVPDAGLAVTITGVCEILGAIGLLVPQTRRLAAFALILFLVAVLPANIYAVEADVTLRGAPPTPVAPRILLQAFFVVALWWSGIRAAEPARAKRMA